MLLATFKQLQQKWVGRIYSDGRLVLVARGSERYVRLAAETFCEVWESSEAPERAAGSLPHRAPPLRRL